MSDVKWIKIKIDIFDDEKMYAIESMQDGLLLELIWFKLLCLAGKCNNHGFLMVNKKIPYTDDMLSKIFRIEIGSIQRALTAFQELEMIEVVDNAYMVSNWDKHQNEQGLEEIRASGRERTRRFRERQKNKALENEEIGCNVTSDVTGNVTSDVKCNVNRSISISNSISNSNSNSFLNSNNLKPTTHNTVELNRSVEQETIDSQDSLNNIQRKKPRKKTVEKKEPIRKEVYYPLDEKLDATFKDFVKMREDIKKPFKTMHAIDLSMKKLEKLSAGDNDKAIEILENSIRNEWQDVYALKDETGKKDKGNIMEKWLNA